MDWPFEVEGQSKEDVRRNPLLNLEAVTPRYFEAMHMRLRRGRTFDDRDVDGAPGVVVVSEALARRYWPGQDPVGKRLKIPLPGTPYDGVWLGVVGEVGDARYRELQAARLDLYMSFLQSREPLRHWVVRTADDPRTLAASVRAAVRALDQDLVVSDVTTMDALVDASLGNARFGMQLLSGFAVAALLLAALGIYGAIAFIVGRRTREIGVRMALGARRGDVMALVVRQGMGPVLLGVMAGIAGSLGLGRGLAGLLFGVGPRDAATLGGAAALLAVVALAACYLPARRAARIDPALALRDE